MPSRFTFIAMALAAPLWLAACEQEAETEAEVPEIAETQTAEPAEPASNAEPAEQPETNEAAVAEPEPGPAAKAGQAAPEGETQAAGQEGEVMALPPEAQPAPPDERRTAQAPERQPAERPGEPSPEAAGVASVAAYIGRWSGEAEMCRESYWVFTSLRLETPGNVECDIESTEELENGIELQVACTDEAEPLAEPRRGTMTLTFPNLPQTDTMLATGGPLEDSRTLRRCPRG